MTKLNLSFDDGRAISVNVSPPLANLILHFETKPSWTLAELAAATGSGAEAVRRRMVYWVGCGVCAQTSPASGGDVEDITYTVIENAEAAGAHKTHFAMVEEEDSETKVDDGQVRGKWGGGGVRVCVWWGRGEGKEWS